MEDRKFLNSTKGLRIIKIRQREKCFILGLAFLITFGCAASFVTKSNKYATTEITWVTYKDAVLRGDIEASFNCFAEYVRDMARKKYIAIGIEGIQERVRTIKEFQLIGSTTINNPWLHRTTEYKEYKVITEKGQALFIFFVRIDDEWKIEQLPSVIDIEGFNPKN